MIGQLYYSNEINGEYIVLDNNESRHFRKVMRTLPESETYITDGLGTIYKCKYYSKCFVFVQKRNISNSTYLFL